ncbi:MAG TPA: hypothetical protein HPP97_07425 [Desulfuromonadales bacterium]|nr:hypothetical protein [Desulfuromonadales bacterium]
MRSIIIYTLLFIAPLTLNACAAKRPVLYPNAQLKEIGQPKADLEIDDCISLANSYKAGGDRTKEIAKDTGKAGIVGAATGAVIGAITGDFGRGAAIGGAGAATAAMGSGIMRSDEPDPVFKQFVEQCLREKGFQPLGWR